MKFLLIAAVVIAAGPVRAGGDADSVRALTGLVGDGENFRGIPFGEVVLATTGHRVIPVDPGNEDDRRLVAMLGPALDATLAALNSPESPARKLARINEASRLFEDELVNRINAFPGWACRPAPNAGGETQRAGYPDLEITDTQTGRVTYLDPKLYAAGSEESSFRTFYYEPKTRTTKITRDARHLVAGISHDARDGAWHFTGWRLTDLSGLMVRLKAEFQASNRDLYERPPVAQSGAR